jgi:hypothetical protein
MHTRLHRLLTLSAVVLLIAITGEAAQLGSIEIEQRCFVGPNSSPRACTFGIWFDGFVYSRHTFFTLFDAFVGPDFPGLITALSSGPTFDAAVAALTNGFNDSIAFCLMSPEQFAGLCTFASEASFFLHDPPRGSGIDFAGNTITAIELALHTTAVDSFDPGGFALFGNPFPWTMLSINATLTVHGIAAVPEPSTYLLLATGLVGLIGYAWRKRKRAVSTSFNLFG